MKSVVVKRVAEKPPKMPCLMLNANAGSNTIVLMSSVNEDYYKGTVVACIDSASYPRLSRLAILVTNGTPLRSNPSMALSSWRTTNGEQSSVLVVPRHAPRG